MKVLVFMVVSLTLFSCANKESSIINNFNNKFGDAVISNISETRNMYTYEFPVDKGINEMDYMKNFIDKKMGMLPTKTIPSHVSATGDYLYDSFEWENPNMKIEMEPHVKYRSDKIVGMRIKIWITKK